MSIELYAAYLKERENTELICVDSGFITYRFELDYCYIIDIYILPEMRKNGLGVELENRVIEQARERKVFKLLGSVDRTANNWETSIKILEKIGYKPYKQDKSVLFLIKEI